MHQLNSSEQCRYVNATRTCHIDEGYIDYTIFVYCEFSALFIPLAIIILVRSSRVAGLAVDTGRKGPEGVPSIRI